VRVRTLCSDAGGGIVLAVSTISVLVVDDHAVFADALQARLSSEPDLAPVFVAYSIAEATARLGRTALDVAIVDLTLGDGSGLVLAERAVQLSPSTRIMFLSAADSVESVVDALTFGARAWLPKTVDIAHLVRVIRGVHAGEVWLAPALLGEVVTSLLARTLPPPPDPLAVLTAREREVLDCMLQGLAPADIATRLRLSINTVRTHTQNLIVKLNVHSAMEAVALALRTGQRSAYS
jgi:DNA-binding NarL/FixJ family response regulator